ncbi:MAG: C4-type zinc ribbon domain-containing protein [candidate division KSB1 bacterium]|nr:C4-type zinc ribbon domain-containing protein [candidate division KSB1 bacterium]
MKEGVTVRQQLQLLVNLQEIDSRLQQLEARKGDLPQVVRKLEDERGQLTATLSAYRTQTEQWQREKRQAEGRLATLKDQLKKYQTQLYSRVTTNREYDAITAEIEATEKQIDDVEMSILELDDQIEKVARDIAELEQRLGQLDALLAERQAELASRMKETEEEVARLSAQRAEVVAQLNQRVLARYDRIRAAKGGVAVVPVQNSACGGCFTTIPPQRSLEVRQMKELILCESCGRILVWQGNE